jgi:hypothetical protein
MMVMAWGHAGVIDNGGIALEESYPYLMQDAWCLKTDRSSGVKVPNRIRAKRSSVWAVSVHAKR